MIDLRHFMYFLAVAEELHFGRAAERLSISQPGLSRQIRQMEELLGVALFERDKRHVALTSAGEYLKGEVIYMTNHLEEVKKQVRRMDQGIEGELRVGFLGSAMQVIPDLLLRINELYPAINTSLEEMANKDQITALEKDEIDIGFVRLGRLPRGIQSKTVFTDTFSLVVPHQHPINAKNFKSMKQVAREHFILFSAEYSAYYYDQIMSICEDQGFQPNVSHKSVHALTIFKLVESGLGVAIVPTTLQQGFDLGIRFIELKSIRQQAVLSAVWREQNRNPVLKKVVTLIAKM